MEMRIPAAQEKERVRNTIHFEPGIHPNTKSEMDSVYNELKTGSLEVSLWNKEVGKRIASYAFDAPGLLLTIDGLEGQPFGTHPDPHQEAIHTWVSLPTRPEKLNQTQRAYVVRGDTVYSLPQAILTEGAGSPSIKRKIEDITQAMHDQGESIEKNAYYIQTGGIGVLGALLWAGNKFLGENQHLSRRQFLDKAILFSSLTLMSASLLRYSIPMLASSIPNEPTEAFLQTVANVVRARRAQIPFFDGRTALLIAKAEDAQQSLSELSQVENVIVMGDDHMEMAPTYIQDREERKNVIATYAAGLLETAREIYAQYYHISLAQLPPQVVQSVLNYVSQVDIVQVTDPGGPSMQPNFSSVVDKQIIPVKSFNSPQVGEAITHLRPA